MAEFIYTMKKARKAHGEKVILDDVTLMFLPGAKIGVVGPNGAGKSTVLQIMAGLQQPSNGEAFLTPGYTVGILLQEPVLDETKNVLENVQEGVAETMALLNRFNAVSEEMASPDADYDKLLAEMGTLQEQLDHRNAWDLDSQLEQAMDALRCPAPDADVKVLSGGEKRRVALCKLLLQAPDLLLLDEPTNHLDVDAKTWLLGFLRDYRGALLVISHDLELLDEAITRVLHLDRAQEDSVGEIVEYRGTYTQYLSSRAADESRLAKKASLQEKEVARLQGVVDRFGAKASKAAMAHSIEKRIARIEETKVEGPSKDRQLKVRFPEPPAAGQTVITASGLRKTFGGPDIFHDVSFDLGRGERLLVLGLNGAGKTTLLRMLAGESKPDAGDIEFGYQVTSGYFAQEHDNLDPEASLIDHMRRHAPVRLGLTETQLRGMLGMFGLSGTKVFQESATLSGGEKTKLALAMLMVGRNNLLFLDEPTNNLDPPSRQAVADALSAWKGAIILVSHDTEFVEQLAPTKVLLMPDGQVDYFSNEWLDLVSLA